MANMAGKNRLEAFSDGVIAIIITIMVLELKVPHTAELNALLPLFPALLSYILSFIYVGIYWNNHHHLLHLVSHVSGGILWANLYLLFSLSLIPFVTAWAGENHFAAAPAALYGIILLQAALAWQILQRAIIVSQGTESVLLKAVGSDFKGKFSLCLYLVAILSACFVPWLACSIYALVAIIWLVPDKRIENRISGTTAQGKN